MLETADAIVNTVGAAREFTRATLHRGRARKSQRQLRHARSRSGRFAFYEHLKPGSVTVRLETAFGAVRSSDGSAVPRRSIGPTSTSTGRRQPLARADGLPFVFESFDELRTFRSLDALIADERWFESRPEDRGTGLGLGAERRPTQSFDSLRPPSDFGRPVVDSSGRRQFFWRPRSRLFGGVLDANFGSSDIGLVPRRVRQVRTARATAGNAAPARVSHHSRHRATQPVGSARSGGLGSVDDRRRRDPQPGVDRGSGRDDHAPPLPRPGRAFEDLLLRRGGSAAGHRLRVVQGLRGPAQQEARPWPRQGPRRIHPHHSWRSDSGAARGPRRRRRLRLDDHAGSAREGRLHDPHLAGCARNRGDRTPLAADRDPRRSLGQGDLPPQVVVVLGTPRGLEPALQRRRQAAGDPGRGSRGTRERGPARDVERRSLRHHRGRRADRRALGEGLHRNPPASRDRDRQRRRDRLDDSPGLAEVESGARLVRQDARAGHDVRQYHRQALRRQ